MAEIKPKDPDLILSEYTYEPKTDRYIYTKTIGNFNLVPPRVLTPREYYELKMKENMKWYFKEKSDAVSGLNPKSQKNLLPGYYKISSKFYETLFGNEELNFITVGAFEVDLGVRHQRIDNPSIITANRTSTIIDFDQRFNIGVTANIGSRLRILLNYDTQSTFNFQNIAKIQYVRPSGSELVKESLNTKSLDTAPLLDKKGIEDTTSVVEQSKRKGEGVLNLTDNDFRNVATEIAKEELIVDDGIVKKFDIGNVSMPLNSALISGPQSLFGVMTQLQFGKTTVTAAIADQRSQTKRVHAQGGKIFQEFDFSALDYDQNRHYFLGQIFRDRYNKALEHYPFVNSKFQITRIEVWVTNRSRQTSNVRNIVALQDLGEPNISKTHINRKAPADFFNGDPDDLPNNNANDFDPETIGTTSVLNDGIRELATVRNGFELPNMVQGSDYSILENAQKLQEEKDFTVNKKLGYISLNKTLSSDEILAVAYQYSYEGKIYQVGEFANGSGIESTQADDTNKIKNKALVLKMLKSNITNVNEPIWDLMMKNIYNINAYKISEEDFSLNIYYADPSPINYITPVDESSWDKDLSGQLLLKILHFDNLDFYKNPSSDGDGFFDFIEGITINSESGRIIFTKVEPFGNHMHQILGGGDYDNTSNYNANQQKYVYKTMYDQTKAKTLQDFQKNKYLIKGRYKSESGGGISLGAFNIPRGSVKVTVGGRILQEGIDYTVNYQSGYLRILDPSLENSNTPIDIKLENNAVFARQNKRFYGFNVEHRLNDKLLLGATWLNLNEKPLTQKVSYGAESVDNSIYGFKSTYSTELPFLTRLLNKIPTIDTDTPSELTFKGEVAYIAPSAPSATNLNGKVTTYIDDFEGAQIFNSIKGARGWHLSSVPDGFGGNNSKNNDITSGYNRAKMAWYTIDPIFYTTARPTEITNEDVSLNATRRIFIKELFEQQDVAQGQTTVQNTLDLAYYPNEKGPYNNNPNNFRNSDPNKKWAGIMRALPFTNLEKTNVEYLQFWILDPYTDPQYRNNKGKLYINIGKISEDILKDGRKQYENGLGEPGQPEYTTKTAWGKVPSSQSLIYAFDSNPASRKLQDVGLDGLNDSEEVAIYGNNPPEDPALDNYKFYLATSGNVLERYKNYNGTDGNSPVQVQDNERGAVVIPDAEDVDRDQTMNTIDSYYQYQVALGMNISTSSKYVASIKETTVQTIDNNTIKSRWIQYKIPITKPDKIIGNLNDLRSVSHIRLFLSGFDSPIVVRFGTLDLVGKSWRTYEESLQSNNDNPKDDGTKFEVNTVNIQENETRKPIPYKLPPNIKRQVLNVNNSFVRQNEQSLSLNIQHLEKEDARAVFRRVDYDFRQYKNLELFIHAENLKNNSLYDNELLAFIRLGTDLTDNYYQVELPLKITTHGARNTDMIWPKDNQLLLPFDKLISMKAKRVGKGSYTDIIFYSEDLKEVAEFTQRKNNEKRYAIKGNPSLARITTIMIGVKNSTQKPLSGEVWFNELRISELENTDGWATVGELNLNIADFANISGSGKISSIGFGNIEQTPNERNLQDSKHFEVLTSVNAGQLLPQKWSMTIPFSYNQSQKLITPKYDPFYQDVILEKRMDNTSEEKRDDVLDQALDYTRTYGFNLLGVRKNKSGGNPHFYDLENLSADYSYSNTKKNNYQIESLSDRWVKTGLNYTYRSNNPFFEPFKNSRGILSKEYMKLFKDINFNPLPTSITSSSYFSRNFKEQCFRQIQSDGIDNRLLVKRPSLQLRNYLFDLQYAMVFNLTKSLQLDYTASSNRIVKNYFQKDVKGNNRIDSKGNPLIDRGFDLWDDFWNLGDANTYNHRLELSYKIPINKLPYLDFINSNYNYTADFQWIRGSDVITKLAKEKINTVQNAARHTLTGALDFNRLYDKLGVNIDEKTGFSKIGLGLVTMIKRGNASINLQSGTVLPGYTGTPSFLGTLDPSFGFIFGDQANILDKTASRGLLTTYEDFNEFYTQKESVEENYNISLEPFKGLIIDLKANRRRNENYQESFRVVNDSENNNFQYEKLSGVRSGSFSVSTNLIATSFFTSKTNFSKAFNDFKANRQIVARRLAKEKGIDLTNSKNYDSQYPKGFSRTNQAVLIPSFLVAYKGSNVAHISLDPLSSVPLPNWDVKFTGLMNLEAFQNTFNRFSIRHAYTSNFNINSYRTNLDYKPNAMDKKGDYINELVFGSFTLNERFSPLLNLAFELKNSFSFNLEISRIRLLTLSFDNNLLTEVNSKDYQLGMGYIFRDISITSSVFGPFKGNINIKLALTYKDDATYLRNLDVKKTQVSSGTDNISGKLTADYTISKNFNAIFYYDHNFAGYKISTAFPTTTIRAGFTLRYTF
ncbi:cell surface protein SprA [Elysia marginata]|uniref:Cell surface protein SprA n=1 Tax=Elysia marginata TaxID=1093978 RepID=A0AAV4FQ52_9GAST|nr:cell surface protein SprA [Elysia marginata]